MQSADLGFNLSGFFVGSLFTHRDRRLLDAIAHGLPCLKAPADRFFSFARVVKYFDSRAVLALVIECCGVSVVLLICCCARGVGEQGHDEAGG